MPSAERITGSLAYHGEGPFWDEPTDRFLFMDVLEGAVISVAAQGTATRHQLPTPVATVIRRRASGGFVVAAEHDLLAVSDDFEAVEQIVHLADDPTVRTNDGGCDRLGNFVIGTMAYDGRADAGAVYRVTPDRRVVEILSPVSISNGVQWSTDGARVYYVDTPTRRVDVFDVDAGDGSWSNRRTYICVEESAGSPDGMAIDEDGGLWVALWGGGAVKHYDPAGQLVETISVPGVSQVSSCTFGGQDRRTLYITTSRQGLPNDAEPDAGALFAVPTDVRGAAQAEFGG